MADDDRTSDVERATVDRAAVALPELDQVLPAIHAEVAARVRARDVTIDGVRSGHPVLAASDREVGEDLHVLVEPLRADVALHEPARREVDVVERPHLRREDELAELVDVDLAIAGHQHRGRRAGHVEHHALQRLRGLHAQQRGQRLDRRRVRRVDLGERLRPLARRLRRLRPRSLGVRQVVAVLAFDEQILADARPSHELVVDAAADLPGIRLDDHQIQTEAVEDPLVRLVHDAVRLAHAVLVAVDRIGVLHQELATAKQPEPRPELVAVLPLDLVDVHRQVAVRRQIAGREQRDDLLLRGAEDQLAIVTIGRA